MAKSRCAYIMSVFCMAGMLYAGNASFSLQGLQDHKKYGPYEFVDGGTVKVPSGDFRLKLGDGGGFILHPVGGSEKYGVYELVDGRIIDVGGTLYVETDIIKPAVSEAVPVQDSSFLDDSSFGVNFDLISNTKYDWTINDIASGSAEMRRTSAGCVFSKGYVNARLGLVLASEWDESVDGDGAFDNATLKSGSGWYAGAGIKVPFFQEGGWRGEAFGDFSYRSEELALKYGAWQSETTVSTSVTNGITNTTGTVNYTYKEFDEDATLTETLVTLGAVLNYESRGWFGYGGIKVLAWSDSSLDATVVNGPSRYELEFERSDPVMVYGGGGFVLKGVKCYLEIEGGGENAVRIGLLKDM